MNKSISTVFGQIEDIASKFPDRIALKDQNSQCSYSELIEQVNLVSQKLTAVGVKLEQRVAIMTDKSIETMVCFFGVMNAGAIPLLVDAMDSELSTLSKCEAMEVHHVITFRGKQVDFLGRLTSEIIDRNELFARTGTLRENSNNASYCSEICYMITTSGTTGVPKGISVSHQNVLHYAKHCLELLDNKEVLRCGHVTNLSTDLGHTNWLLALTSGGFLRIFSDNESRDPQLFKNVIEEDKINFLKTTRSHFDAMASFLLISKKTPQLKYLFLGGEKLQRQFVDRLYQANLCSYIYNHYGPSETTIGALIYKIPQIENSEIRANSVPIGTVFGENKAYIINEKNGLGELCIEGAGVSLGYYTTNSPSSFFINKKTKERGYRTGDICREVAPNLFEFCYRLDRQVKINGYRVELDEIEAVIESSAQVNYTKLNTFVSNGDLILEAYIKPIELSTFNKEKFLTELKGKLSNYKIPQNFYIQEFCTYNRNGKIDFDQMRKKTAYQIDDNFNAWDSWGLSVEHCWANVLGQSVINKTDDFFESGGNSLSAMRLIAKLQINGYDVGISDINDYSVLGDFIQLNRQRSIEKESPIKTDFSTELTLSQRNFLNNDWVNPNKYCQSVLLETNDAIEINVFSRAIFELKNAHFELSQSYLGNQAYSYPKDLGQVDSLEIYHLSENLPISSQILQISDRVNDKINLVSGELFKAALIFDDNTQKKYVYLSCHHLATDIVSWDIMLDEFITRYSRIQRGEVGIGRAAERLKADFFNVNQEKRSSEFPIFLSKEIQPLPKKYTPSLKHHTGNFVIDHKLNDSDITKMSQNNQFLYAFAKSIIHHFELEKVSIDIEFHGRPSTSKVDVSRSVSWWAVSLPLEFNTNQDLASLNESIQTYSKYASEVNLTADNNTMLKKADVRFNFLGNLPEKFTSKDLTLAISDTPTVGNRDWDSKNEYLIVFTCRIIEKSLIADIQYDKAYFGEADIYLIAKYFVRGLQNVDHQYDYGKMGMEQTIMLPSNINSIGKPFFKVQNTSNIASNPSKVMLTGATGFLGIYVLRELLLNNVTVHCIVRGETQTETYNRLQGLWDFYFTEQSFAKFHSQIKVYAGDIALKQFGLAKDDFEYLSNEVTAVINCAADVNLSKALENLKVINVDIIDELVGFTKCGINKSIHHISTLAVSGVWEKGTAFSEDTFNGNQTFVSNYEESKFLAEKKLRDAIDLGVEGKIYRVGHIAGDSISGKFQHNQKSNRIVQLINGMIELGAIPESFDEKISFSHVDIVAKMLVNVVLKKVNTGKICLHLENPNYNIMPTIVNQIGDFQKHIRVVKDDEFEQLMNYYLENNLELDAVLKMQFWLNRNKNNKRNINFLSNYSNDLFAKHGLVFNALKADWLTLFLTGLSVKSRVETMDLL